MTHQPDYRPIAARLLGGLEQRGTSIANVLAHCSLPESLLTDTAARVTGQQLLHLMRSSIALTDDEFLGLTRNRCKPGTLSMMIETGMHSGTLQGFIEHCCRFYYLVTDDATVEFINHGNQTELSWYQTYQEEDPMHFLAEHYLLLFHRVFSWSCGLMLPLISVNASLDEPPSQHRLQYYLKKDWNSRQAVDSFVLDNNYLTLPLIRTPHEARETYEYQRQQIPIWPDDRLTWSARVRAALIDSFEHSPSNIQIEHIAEKLYMTSRSLRRHLNREGTGFQPILDDVRLNLAIEKLHIGHLSVADISAQLGFSDSRSFSRAFKKWKGVTTRDYIKADTTSG